MESVLGTLQRLGPARLGAMALIAVLLLGFFSFIIARVSQPQMVPLYSELSFEDSTAIVEFLEGQGTTYKLSGNGSTVLVPSEMVTRTRMALAGDGLPSGGSVGYEIFDKADTLGTTSFVQNINHVRALEGELARTISAINRIQAARVHLVLPERQLFQRDAQDPSASIVLKVRGRLDANQIRSIQHLVASAVEGLSPGRVSMVDEYGTLLASGNDGEGADALAASLDDKAAKMEMRLRDQIREMLSSVVGPGRARVQVTAELHTNRITQTSESFDPESQVVRSTQNRTEASKSTEPANNNGVTVANELPSANAGGDEAQERESNDVTEETINYEISRTQKTEIQEPGTLKKMSVAVLVDGTYTTAQDGTVTYNPRTDEELQRIATIVRSAIGFDENRGDVVEVVNMEFAEKPGGDELLTAEAGALTFSKDDYFRMAELGVIAVLTLLVLFTVIRPLLKRVLGDEEAADAAVAGELVAAEGGAEGAGQQVGFTLNADGVPVFDNNNPTIASLQQAHDKGVLRAEVVAQVGNLIENNPDTAAGIIRGMVQEAA